MMFSEEIKVETNSSQTINNCKTNWKDLDLKSINERMSHLFDNPVMADLVFRLKSDRKLFAHKLVVSSGSQVFHELFNESNNGLSLGIKQCFEDNKHCIDLSDCELKHFQPLIKFLYTDRLDIDEDIATHIVFYATMFGIRRARDICLHFIVSKLNDKNCLKWWQRLTETSQIERTFAETTLIEKCLQMVSRNALNIFRSEDITNLSIESLSALLSRNDLNISEFDLFKAVVRWAQQQCLRSGQLCDDQHLRQSLGPAFDLVRFPLLSSHEFGLIVSSNPKLFTREELVVLIGYINSGIVVEHRLRFTARPRIPASVVPNLSLVSNSYQPLLEPPMNGPFCGCRSATLPIGYPPVTVTHSMLQTYSPMSPIYTSLHSPPVLPLLPNLEKKVKPKTLLTIIDPNTGQNVDLEELVANERHDRPPKKASNDLYSNISKKTSSKRLPEKSIASVISPVSSECSSDSDNKLIVLKESEINDKNMHKVSENDFDSDNQLSFDSLFASNDSNSDVNEELN